jgi:uncharacterized protein with HEPN domain
MRDDTQRLPDIIEAIDRIERYSSRGRDVFDRDELVQNWIVNHLQLIGEAFRSLSLVLRVANQPPPPLPQAIMRAVVGSSGDE